MSGEAVYQRRERQIKKALKRAKEALLHLADVCLEPDIVCEGILERFENLAANGRQRIAEDRILNREEEEEKCLR